MTQQAARRQTPYQCSDPDPVRLRRASTHITEAIRNVEQYRPPDADDADLHHAVDLLLRAQQIVAGRARG